jgi:hypothetical protein
VTIHPGETFIPLTTLNSNDAVFPGALLEILANSQKAEPEMGFRPRITFLVKKGGESTYLKARWQALTGTNYPQSLRMVDAAIPKLPGLEAR